MRLFDSFVVRLFVCGFVCLLVRLFVLLFVCLFDCFVCFLISSFWFVCFLRAALKGAVRAFVCLIV